MERLTGDNTVEPARLHPAQRSPVIIDDQEPPPARTRSPDLGGRRADTNRRLGLKRQRWCQLKAQRPITPVPPREIRHEVINGVRQQVCRVGQLREPATRPQYGDLVAQLDGLVDVVSDEDDGLTEIDLETEELVLKLLAHDRVHRAEGLIHEHHGRVSRQSASHTDTLLLAAGELRGITLREAGRQAHPLEELKSAGFGPAFVPAQQPRDGSNVRDYGAVREKASVLDDVSDAPPKLRLVHLGGVLVVNPDPAACGLDHPVDHSQRRRLAASGRPDKNGDLAGRSLEGQLIHRPGAIRKLLRDRIEPDHADKHNRHPSKLRRTTRPQGSGRTLRDSARWAD